MVNQKGPIIRDVPSEVIYMVSACNHEDIKYVLGYEEGDINDWIL